MSTRTFELFGTAHVLAVLLCVLLIAITIHTLALVSDGGRKNAFRWIRWVVVLDIVVWRGLFVLTHQFRVGTDLPIAVCSVSTILLAVYFWRPKQVIFDVLFYWIIVGSSLALLLPDLAEPFPSLRFFAMFVSHAVNLFGMIYLVVIRRDEPSQESPALAFRMLVAYALLFALPVDWALHSNYLYLFSPPAIGLSLVKLLPSWPWYWFVLLAFFYGAFHFAHAVHTHYFKSAPLSDHRYAD